MNTSIINSIEQKSPTSYEVKLQGEYKTYVVSTTYSPSIASKKAGDTICYTKKGKFINVISFKDIAIGIASDILKEVTETAFKIILKKIFK
ncbi:hypothetical protein V9L05_18100 [Bernardetia sp. Wsw4-3y2]|uniref:hypothetical protein n=1 Tax=Bernardetia sp. Wsw4-3y2 TaxID=3127471 RepID=UPI0030D073F0